MRWAITGTPGTGKTTVARELTLDRPIVHLHDVLEDDRFRADVDERRGTDVADLEQLSAWLNEQSTDVVVESHLSHVLPVDRVVVLRCHPTELRSRLEDRPGMTDEKCDENVESERLDLILAEAVAEHGEDHVFEIDTTGDTPATVSRHVEQAIQGEREPAVGIVSFLEER